MRPVGRSQENEIMPCRRIKMPKDDQERKKPPQGKNGILVKPEDLATHMYTRRCKNKQNRY